MYTGGRIYPMHMAGRIYLAKLGRNYRGQTDTANEKPSLATLLVRSNGDMVQAANKQQIVNKHYRLPALYDIWVIYACKYVPSKNSQTAKTCLIHFKTLSKNINKSSYH